MAQGSSEINSNVWGKTIDGSYYPLFAHMLDVATMGGVLWDSWLRPGLRQLVAEQFGEKPREKFQFLAGLHDIGKCSAIFQGALLGRSAIHAEQVEKLKADGFSFPGVSSRDLMRRNRLQRHEKLGVISIFELRDFLAEPAPSNPLAVSMLGHHGDFQISLSHGRGNSQIDLVREFIDQGWTDEQEEITATLKGALGLSEGDLDFSLDTTALVLVSGLVVMADRLASSEHIARAGHQGIEAGKISIQDPAGWLAAGEDTCREFARSQVGFTPKLKKEMILGDFEPRGVQKRINEAGDLAIVAEATGAGKTEAALLRHLEREEALTFLLPTQATTDAMMKRMTRVFEGGERTVASLAHGMAFLEDFYNQPVNDRDRELIEVQGLVRSDFTRITGGRLGASVNVATIDQMVMAGLPVKWTHLRLLLLANAHIVIDEAHLLDSYQTRLLSPILDFLGRTGARVTVLSATLPDWLEREISESYVGKAIKKDNARFPTLLSMTKDGQANRRDLELNRYRIDFELQSTENVAEAHIVWARGVYETNPSARLGIFVNQISRAQEIATALAAEFPDAHVLCLHSRLLAGHKKRIVEELLRHAGIGVRPVGGPEPGLILVGTQVVEVSLDIDLDFISTDLAPAPSLIQRLGRQWRARDDQQRFRRIPKSARQIVRIVATAPDGRVEKVPSLPYASSCLQRTHDFLRARCDGKVEVGSTTFRRGCLPFPEDVQEFVETVRIDDQGETDLGEDALEEKAAEMLRGIRGGSVALRLSALYRDEPAIMDFGILTSAPGIEEEQATRLIEYQTGTLILQAGDPALRELGALPPGLSCADLENTVPLREAQQASVSITRRMEKFLMDDKIDLLEEEHSGGTAFFGPLPAELEYDMLVGLRET